VIRAWVLFSDDFLILKNSKNIINQKKTSGQSDQRGQSEQKIDKVSQFFINVAKIVAKMPKLN
jgi:hypothetical protein